MPARPTLLVLSFSGIAGDARVLKQVALFRDQYDVVTCGLGKAPEGVVEHVRIPDGLSASRPYGRWLTLKQYRLAYWRQNGVRWVRSRLAGRRFDAILANDVEAVPLATKLAPRRRVHADLHEYSPRMREERPNWRRRVGRYLDWVCRRYVSRVASWTTVNSTIADAYAREFHFRPSVVTNATPLAALHPKIEETGPSRPMRLVHSGGCMPHRGLEEIIDAVRLCRSGATLDLYLVSGAPDYEKSLKERAESDDRIRFRAGVPYSELIAVLNEYDVGIHVLPPLNFNHRNALPNKIFDYVQARLAVITGPTAPMARLVVDHSLGWVTDDFSAAAIAQVIDSLTVESVSAAKLASHQSAASLSAEEQAGEWERAVRRIAPPAQDGDRE